MLIVASTARAAPHVTIDVSRVVERVRHRAAGALYGFSNRTPTDQHLKPIRPQFLRMASGRNAELARGNFSKNPYCVFQMYDRAAKLGVRRIEVMCNLYAPKTWATWDVRNPEQSLRQWLDRLEKIARLKVDRNCQLIYYDLFNEPDLNGSPDAAETAEGRKGQKDGFTALGKGDFNKGFHRAWRESCLRVRTVDPVARIVGPSFANTERVKDFLIFCRDQDCLPDILSFHQLSQYGPVTQTIEKLRGVMEELAIDQLPLSINEYGSPRELGRPHPSCMYICQMEREQIETGIGAYWFAPGTFGSILNAYGQVRPGWWLYRWYGEMDGHVLVSQRSTPFADALACLDQKRRQIVILFTADEKKAGPKGKIQITNLNDIPFLKQGDQCRITLTRTPYGVDQRPTMISCRNVARQDTLNIIVPYVSDQAAFRVAIGPATDAPEVNALTATQEIAWQSPTEEMPTKQGLNASVFHGKFETLPSFSELGHGELVTVDAFDIHRQKKRGRWHQPKIAGRFAVAFDGYVRIPTGNVYTFYLQSFGGSRLYINDRLVADNGNIPAQAPDQGENQYRRELPEAHGQIAFERGFHRIRVEYVVQGAGELVVHYSSPSLPRRVIPKETLWH